MQVPISLSFVGILGVLGVARGAHGEAVPLVERPDHVTEAVVTLDAKPAEIYQLITDYGRWPAILTDVTSVKVESGGREDAHVRFRSRALGREFVIAFHNEPDRLIRFEGIEGPPGGRATGTYALEPLDGGKRTRVTARMYMDVKGVAGVFVRDSTIRNMRRAKLEADVTDVARHFAGGHPG